jgi:hypothetical protein
VQALPHAVSRPYLSLAICEIPSYQGSNLVNRSARHSKIRLIAGASYTYEGAVARIPHLVLLPCLLSDSAPRLDLPLKWLMSLRLTLLRDLEAA